MCNCYRAPEVHLWNIFMAFHVIKAIFDPLISSSYGFATRMLCSFFSSLRLDHVFHKIEALSDPPSPELTLSLQCVLAFSLHVACKLLTHWPL